MLSEVNFRIFFTAKDILRVGVSGPIVITIVAEAYVQEI